MNMFCNCKGKRGTSFRELNEEEDPFSSILLDNNRKAYESGDTASALTAFLLCYQQRVYPPTWVMDWLGEAFSGYLEADGHRNLEKELGLNAPGRGQTKPAARAKHYANRKPLAVCVWICVRLLNVPVDEAANSVIRLHESHGEDNLPSPEWLAEECRRVWLRVCDAEAPIWERLFADGIGLESFVASFPKDCRPTLG